MTESSYGRVSRCVLTAGIQGGQTVLRDLYTTPPFRIMRPFYREGFTQVILMSASAGLMAGDRQQLHITVKSGARLLLTGQSYEKLHWMESGHAARETRITVEGGGLLHYHPLPTIPFAGTAFRGRTEFYLEDDTAGLVMSEILAAGRGGMGEAFQYRQYHQLTCGRQAGELIYYDNVRLAPDDTDLTDIGMYEGYTHLLSLLICNLPVGDRLPDVQQLLYDLPEGMGGASCPRPGQIVVRALGHSGDMLVSLREQVLSLLDI